MAGPFDVTRRAFMQLLGATAAPKTGLPRVAEEVLPLGKRIRNLAEMLHFNRNDSDDVLRKLNLLGASPEQMSKVVKLLANKPERGPYGFAYDSDGFHNHRNLSSVFQDAANKHIDPEMRDYMGRLIDEYGVWGSTDPEDAILRPTDENIYNKLSRMMSEHGAAQNTHPYGRTPTEELIEKHGLPAAVLPPDPEVGEQYLREYMRDLGSPIANDFMSPAEAEAIRKAGARRYSHQQLLQMLHYEATTPEKYLSEQGYGNHTYSDIYHENEDLPFRRGGYV